MVTQNKSLAAQQIPGAMGMCKKLSCPKTLSSRYPKTIVTARSAVGAAAWRNTLGQPTIKLPD